LGVKGLAVACLTLATLLSAQVAGQQIPEAPEAKPPSQPPASQQSPSATPPAPQPSQTGDGKKDSQNPEKKGTSNDRLFFTLPNFLTVENTGQVAPLAAGQKFKVVARSSFDYVVYPWYGFLAGISQAQNSEAGYGQGAAGYGKRFGAYFADGTIENFMVGAVIPSLLRQDPRYFRSGKGGFWRRTGYTVSRMFVTRTDSGHEQCNFSEIVGSAMSAGISTYSYHPHEDRTLRNTASVWGAELGSDAITVLLREFWPDIRRKLSKNKQAGGAPKTP
jgi:hypothetical protein